MERQRAPGGQPDTHRAVLDSAALVPGFTHDLNAPLGSCITATSVLASALARFRVAFESGQVKRSSLQDLLDTAEHASRLLDGNLARATALVRAFSILTAPVSDSAEHGFSLRPALDHLALAMAGALKGHGARLDIHCDTPVALAGPSSPLLQVLGAVALALAAHGGPHGAATVLRLEAGADPDGHAVIRISDGGPGLDPPRQQACQEGAPGAGTGDALVDELVAARVAAEAACGARLAVDSVPAVGTVVQVLVPTA